MELERGSRRAGAGGARLQRRAAAATPDLGPNVIVFDPSMSTSQIRATVDAIAAQQVPNEFGTQRYALLFVSRRVGNYQYNPELGVLFDQFWVR